MMAVYGVAPTLAILWLPVVIGATVLLAAGVAYPAALLGIWMPEIGNFVMSFVRVLFFIAPGLVPLSQISGTAHDLLLINPMTGLFESYRDALLYGHSPGRPRAALPGSAGSGAARPVRPAVPLRAAAVRQDHGVLMATSIEAEGLGVRFLFDRYQRAVTPALARVRRSSVETWGVRDLSFAIGPGEGVALIGPSGSGKTTVLRLIAGVFSPDAGRLRVDGRVGSLLSTEAGLLGLLDRPRERGSAGRPRRACRARRPTPSSSGSRRPRGSRTRSSARC